MIWLFLVCLFSWGGKSLTVLEYCSAGTFAVETLKPDLDTV